MSGDNPIVVTSVQSEEVFEKLVPVLDTVDEENEKFESQVLSTVSEASSSLSSDTDKISTDGASSHTSEVSAPNIAESPNDIGGDGTKESEIGPVRRTPRESLAKYIPKGRAQNRVARGTDEEKEKEKKKKKKERKEHEEKEKEDRKRIEKERREKEEREKRAK